MSAKPTNTSAAAALRRRVHRHAFERDLWTRAAERTPAARLAAASNGELRRWFRDAWGLRDLGETCRIGEALHARGALRPSDLSRLRSALIILDRAARAVELGPEPAAAPQDLVALVAAGRVNQARRELAGVDAGEDVETLALIGRALGELEPDAAWDAEAGSVGAALELGCGELAVDLAAKALGQGAPTAEQAPAALELLHAGFRLAEPDAAASLLKALGPLFAADDRAAWEEIDRLRAGGPDQGPVMRASANEPRRLALAHLLASACAAVGRPDAAVRRLGSIDHLALGDTEHLFELARLVAAAEGLTPQYASPSDRRRIFDVFPFNGEFALLDLKLAAMADWVDAFVLVEASRTFTDNPKPLYFDQAKDRYGAYADRIIHVIADAPPSFAASAWAREYHQRDQGLRGLSGLCAPSDLVLISDVDEVVDPAALRDFSEPFATLGMRSFYYFLNYERIEPVRQERKVGVVEARMLRATGLSALRVGMWRHCKRRVPDAGWHFSSVLSPEDIELKVHSYSHEEHQSGTAAVYAEVTERIRAGYRQPGFARAEIDASFPQVLRDRPEPFAEFILHEPDA